ncbi:hypothetical protein [Methylocella silvestris]|uniref:hypothetical protein n=1 Tax=Methylocella silvestris TaxID=199596 RepID=UPI001FE10C34|nr:hypothetical protein [Methylocella silvestris]
MKKRRRGSGENCDGKSNERRRAEDCSVYRVKFIRHIVGRADPEVLHVTHGIFPDLYGAIDEGNLLFGTSNEVRGAGGFCVVKGGAGIVAHRFRTYEVERHGEGQILRRAPFVTTDDGDLVAGEAKELPTVGALCVGRDAWRCQRPVPPHFPA